MSLSIPVFSLYLCFHLASTHNAASHLNVSHLMSFIVSLAVVRCRFVGCWLNFHCFWPCLEKCIDSHDDKTIAFYLKLRRRRRSATPKTEREKKKPEAQIHVLRKSRCVFAFLLAVCMCERVKKSIYEAKIYATKTETPFHKVAKYEDRRLRTDRHKKNYIEKP